MKAGLGEGKTSAELTICELARPFGLEMQPGPQESKAAT